MELWMFFLAVLAALVAGLAGGLYGRRYLLARRGEMARGEASRILAEANEQRKAILVEAREEALQTRSSGEQELKDRRNEVQRQERRLARREENLERRSEGLERREGSLWEKESEVEQRLAEAEEYRAQQGKRLEEVGGLSASDAREVVLRKAEEEAQHELAVRYRDLEQQFREEADEHARRILTLSIHRLASDVVSEHTTRVVGLPSDDMKGRLIGREGRNIRALEQATGVDLIIDDTPEAVTLSCFDPVRREIARVAVENLVRDGRIHPARIEDTVERCRREVEEDIRKAGEQAVLEARVRGLNPELVKLLGRLKFRYSYGENALKHAVEVSLVAGMIAAEVGVNVEVAKCAGLLHDIGKALTHEAEGSHTEIGGEIARRFGIPEEVRRGIMEHHDEERGSLEAFIVSAADAISAARPGARKETAEQYVQRLEALENVATSFDVVEKAYAIQAGREVRILVQPDSVDDAYVAKLARDVAKKIEESLVYPGQIKVMVIRETRSVEFAR